MKRFKYILFIILSLCTHICYGQMDNNEQQIIPQSPTVASLVQHVDCPVSYYSGTPSINIPLYEINVDNVTIPLSLSYHASGIKVSQESSWVGLGWSLQAGGCISRSVQCYDDFNEYYYPSISVKEGYFESGDIVDPHADEYYTHIFPYLQLTTDSEPDIFYYSFPGHSGKFILDKSRGAVLFNKSDGVKVCVEEEYNRKYFRLIAKDGTQYIFNIKELLSSYSQEGSLHNNSSNPTAWDNNVTNYMGSPVQYTSTWFLNKIITANKREITFTYETENYESPAQESCLKYHLLATNGTIDCQKNTSPYYSKSKSVSNGYRLKRIDWDGGYATFTTSEREDVKAVSNASRKLDGIRVYDKDDNLVKGYNFAYSYFNAAQTGTYAYVFKRLKLDSITDVTDSNLRYSFGYYAGNLPAKNSKNTDYWGYYNGANYGANYYATTTFNGTIYNGQTKNSNLNYLRIGTLNSIQYPTGGTEYYTFEENTYEGANSETSGSTQSYSRNVYLYNKYEYDEFPDYAATDTVHFTLTQSARIAITGYLENYGEYGYEDYELTDYILRIRPLNSSTTTKAWSLPNDVFDESHDFVSYGTTLAAGTYVLEFLSPPKDYWAEWTLSYDVYTPPSSTSTVCNGGGLRIAKIEGGGKTRTFTYSTGTLMVEPVLHYVTPIRCPETSAGVYTYLVQVSESTIPLSSGRDGNHIGYSSVTETVSNQYKTIYRYYVQQEEQQVNNPFIVTTINFQNGQLLSMSQYKGNSLQKDEEYEYDETTSQVIKAFKYKIMLADAISYDFCVTWYNRSLTKTTWYNNTSKRFETEEEISYNSHHFPTSKTSILYDDDYEERTYYPSDFTDAVSQSMVRDNYIGIPVEQLKLVNGEVVSGQKIAYKQTLGLYLPNVKYVLNAKNPLPENNYSSHYEAQTYYDIYDSYGNLMQKRDYNVPTAYLWSYKGAYPVAEIKNAYLGEVETALSNANLTVEELCERQTLTDSDLTALRNLRTQLPNAQVTLYTYTPLVGVGSITDPSGFTTYFDYDSSGRLYEIYYMDGTNKQIIEHYNYHYKNK